MPASVKLKLAIVLISTVVMFGSQLYLKRERITYMAPFKPHLHEYLQMPARMSSRQPRPLIQKGFLPINIDTGRIDDLYLSMPSDLRAEHPEDVKTLVWVRWRSQRVNRPRRGFVREQVCLATVIDRASKVIVGDTTLIGPTPFGAGVSGELKNQIFFYLYSFLPPKNAAPKAPSPGVAR